MTMSTFSRESVLHLGSVNSLVKAKIPGSVSRGVELELRLLTGNLEQSGGNFGGV